MTTTEPTRRGLFVGGPWHGTIRDAPADRPVINIAERIRYPQAALNDPEFVASAPTHRQGRYQHEQFAMSDVDEYVRVDVWTYQGISPTTEPEAAAIQLAAAALRCLLHAEGIDRVTLDP